MTSVDLELQEQRRNYTAAMLEEPGKSLADMSEQQFEAGLKRITRVQERMQQILATALQKERHYGNPNNAFKDPILYKAGAEEIRRLMRARIRRICEPTIEVSEDWVSVTVHLGIYDEMNRLIAERSANCNTKERRFLKRNGNGWIYTDPREMVHQCLAMADKRASVDLTEEAAGATAFFASEEALTRGIEEGYAEEAASAEQLRAIKDAAIGKKLSKSQLFDLMVATTGRPIPEGQSEPFVTASEVQMVLDAIAKWQSRRPVAADPVSPEAARGSTVEDELFGGGDA